jgi:hypothetical protein
MKVSYTNKSPTEMVIKVTGLDEPSLICVKDWLESLGVTVLTSEPEALSSSSDTESNQQKVG